VAKVIPTQAVQEARGVSQGRATGLLRSYHRVLRTGTYGSEEMPHDLTGEDREQLEDAIVVLHERFPDLADEGPERPAADPVDEDELVERVRRGVPTRERRPGGGGGGNRRARRRAAASGFMAGSLIGRARARRYARETGIPAVADSTTSLVLRWFGLLIGLSLTYLILSNAGSAKSGRSAIELLAGGASTLAQVAILPLDPLRAHPTLAQAQGRRARQPARRRRATAGRR
jgi:hypothetical protein